MHRPTFNNPCLEIITILESSLHFGENTESGKKGELSSTEFNCVENNFKQVLSLGLVSWIGDVSVARAFCRLFTCVDEKRAHQFAIAFTNEFKQLTDSRREAYRFQSLIYRLPENGNSHLLTAGVEHLLDYLMNKLGIKAVAPVVKAA